MKRGNYASSLPLGLCPRCLRLLCSEDPGPNAVESCLPDGSLLIAIYCPENSTGAYTVAREHQALRWTLEGPMSLHEFSQQMRLLPAAIIGTTSAAMDAQGEKPAAAEVH